MSNFNEQEEGKTLQQHIEGIDPDAEAKIAEALEVARKIKPVILWFNDEQEDDCPDCGGGHLHRIGCRIVQSQIRLEEKAHEILKTKPNFEKLSLDRQGELSVEIAAQLIRDLQNIQRTILGRLEALVDEYLNNEMEGWK